MRYSALLVVVVVSGLLASAATADEQIETEAQITSRVCDSNRALRAKIAQDDTKAWFGRIDRVKVACRLTSTPTGAIIHDRNRSYPEMKSGVVCPKGVPSGETEQSAWGILATLEPGVGTTERITEAHDLEDDLAIKCEPSDVRAGLVLRVYLSDLDGLRKILAWKVKPTARADAGVDGG